MDLVIFIGMCILVFFISRKNYKNRTKNLSLNFEEFNELIRAKYYSLDGETQQQFLNSLDKDLYLFFNYIILKKSDKRPNQTWTIQQQIIKQQEIMKKLSK